jgi:hypothetical protein
MDEPAAASLHQLFLIVPFYTSGKTDDERRGREKVLVANYESWLNGDFLPYLQKRANAPAYTVTTLDAYTPPERTWQTEEIVPGGVEIRTFRATKGLTVRLKLIKVLEQWVAAGRPTSFVILIDGSGKIEFDAVKEVLAALERNEHVVLGCRQYNLYMSKERVWAEGFENFLITRTFGLAEIPDAQCGCWGFSTRLLDRLPFTATGYEVETDLLICALQSGVDPCFVPVIRKKPPEGEEPTLFSPKDHLAKLAFIMNRLRLTEEVLVALLQQYCGIRPPAPEEARKYLGSIKSTVDIDIDRFLQAIQVAADARRASVRLDREEGRLLKCRYGCKEREICGVPVIQR